MYLKFLFKVTNEKNSRKFLEVPDRTILKVKAGLVRPDGPTQYFINAKDGREKGSVEILVRVIHKTVSADYHNEMIKLVRVFPRCLSLNSVNHDKVQWLPEIPYVCQEIHSQTQ